MYALIVGAGKVGWNLARELVDKGHEVSLIEANRRRSETVEEELEHAIQYGDGTELWVLERAGIERADLVVAGDRDDQVGSLDPGPLQHPQLGAVAVLDRVLELLLDRLVACLLYTSPSPRDRS